MKKSLLFLSTLTAIAFPTATVISCGTSKQNTPPKSHGPSTNQGPSTNKGPSTNQGLSTTQGPSTDSYVDNSIPWSTQTASTDPRVDWTLQTKPISVSPKSSSVDWTLQTKPTLVTPKSPVVLKTIDSSDKALTTFNITTINENPKISGFLADVDSTPRDFRQYDNGLFKIKIDKELIGPGLYYSDESKADMEATAIARSISVGPAITHLPKGIQIIHSSKAASLGGPEGVQVAVSNDHGSADDNGIESQASLVDHEYGHHETMWDFDHILGGTLFDDARPGQESLRDVMVRDFKADGYESMSNLMASSLVSKQGFLNFIPAKDTDFPSDYGIDKAGQHTVFGTPDYPFNAEEVATRALNIMSCRVSWDAKDLYTSGSVGTFSVHDAGRITAFEPPAAFVSDATFRHFAGDSIFGEGKDNSRIDKLIKSYEDDVFGLNKGGITMFGNPNQGGSISQIQLNDFNSVPDLATLEIQDGSGKALAKSVATTFTSRMGFKNELVSNDWTTLLNKPVTQVNDLKLDLKNLSGGYYKVVGKDADGNEVDISKLIRGDMKTDDGTADWKTHKSFLEPEGKHFYINMLQ